MSKLILKREDHYNSYPTWVQASISDGECDSGKIIKESFETDKLEIVLTINGVEVGIKHMKDFYEQYEKRLNETVKKEANKLMEDKIDDVFQGMESQIYELKQKIIETNNKILDPYE